MAPCFSSQSLLRILPKACAAPFQQKRQIQKARSRLLEWVALPFITVASPAAVRTVSAVLELLAKEITTTGEDYCGSWEGVRGKPAGGEQYCRSIKLPMVGSHFPNIAIVLCTSNLLQNYIDSNFCLCITWPMVEALSRRLSSFSPRFFGTGI